MSEAGVTITGNQVSVGGDIVGGDKVTTNYHGVQAAELARLLEAFTRIQQAIDMRPADRRVEKDELRETVSRIEKEVQKGEEADVEKLRRWLLFLAEAADDIFQITIAALASPLMGAAKSVQVLARRLRK